MTTAGAYSSGAISAAPHAPNRNALAGTTLRLGLFPFTLNPWQSLKAGCGITHMQTFGQQCEHDGGYVVEFWDMVTTELGAIGTFHVDWSIVMRQDQPLGPRAFACLEMRTCDAVFFDYADGPNYSPLPPPPEPASGADPPAGGQPPDPFAMFPPGDTSSYTYTAPIWFDAWTGLVLQTRREETMLGALEPFGISLWVALLIFLLAVIPSLLVLLAVLTSSAEKPRKLRALPGTLAHALYHSLAICLAGEDYVWHSGAARLLRLGLLIVVLVLQATYTANLAAIFTRPVFKTHGPASMEALRGSVACTSYAPYYKYVAPHVRTVLTPPIYANNSDGVPDQTTDDDRRAWCHERLIDRTADVWLEVKSVARPIALRHCPSTARSRALAIVPAIHFGPGAFGFAFRNEDSAKAHHFSAASIHALQYAPSATIALNAKYLGEGQVCQPVDFAQLARVEFAPMVGVFLAFAAFAGAGVLLGMCQWVGRYRKAAGQEEEETAAEEANMTEGGMLREVLGRIGKLQSEIEEMRALHPTAAREYN